MKKKALAWAGRAVLAAVLLGVGFYAGWRYGSRQETLPEAVYGMFDWDEETVSDPDRALELVSRLGISRWYQEFPEKPAPEETAGFVQALHSRDVAVYGMVGSAEWGFEEDGHSLIEALDQILEYNETAEKDCRIDGVMIDVEPYTEEQFHEDREYYMDIFVKGMKAAYAHAEGRDLRICVCIPRTYDEIGLTAGLEELIAGACDEVAVMNYGCGDEVERMETEERLARQYGREIHCILEFQEVGRHNLTEGDTYRNKGFQAAERTWDNVSRAYPDSRIIRDYHWSDPVADMLEEQQEREESERDGEDL